MSNELLEFTRRALAADIDRERIAAALAEAGWPDARIRSTLSRYSDSDFPIPVPAPLPALSARDMFVYLLLFLAMTMSVWHLAALSFDIIDVFLPDEANANWVGTEGFNGQVRWNLSTLLVAYPIFAAFFVVTNRRQLEKRARRLSLARRWLTYGALFTAAVTLIGDLIVLVSSLIGGGLTAPLAAKIAVVAVIVGGIFAYYLTLTLREDAE